MDCRRLSEPPANIYRLVSCDAILISRLLVTTDASDSFRVVVQRALARRQQQQKKGEKVLPSGFSFLIINTLQHNKGQRQYSSFHQYQLTFHVALSSSSPSSSSLSPSRPKLERRSSFPRLLTPGPHHPLGYCETRLRHTLFSLTLNQVQHSQQQVSSHPEIIFYIDRRLKGEKMRIINHIMKAERPSFIQADGRDFIN